MGGGGEVKEAKRIKTEKTEEQARTAAPPVATLAAV